MLFSDHVALVTGANRGLGRAIAAALVAAGAKKVYAASRSGDPIGLEGTVPIRIDVTDPETVRAAALACPDVTLLINNAGVAGFGGPVSAPSMDTARHEMEVNYFGTLTTTRSFAPVISANGGGTIVNVASILAYGPIPQVGTYSATKAAVLSMTQSLRGELAPKNIQVLALCPAFVDTDMIAKVDQPKMTPEDVANALVEGVIAGTEEMFPGPSAGMAAAFRADPKGYERKIINFLA